MKKTILSMTIVSLLPALSGMAMFRIPGEPKNARAAAAPRRAFGPAETIRGNLMELVKEQRLIVLKSEGGVPYSFIVTAATKIEVGGQKKAFEDLATLSNTNLSVTFVPTREGNFARKIEVEK